MRQYGKSIFGFVSLVITNLLTNYAANNTPLPMENGHMDWGTLAINLVTTAVGTFSVYRWDNGTGTAPLTDPLKTELGKIALKLAGEPDAHGKHEA